MKIGRFLIYSSPVLVFTAIILGIFLSLDHPDNKNVRGDEKRNGGISSRKISFSEDDIIVGKIEHSSKQVQTASKRRNAKERDREDYRPSCVEEKGTVSSTSVNDNLVDKSALIEENPRDIREVEVHSIIDCSECSSSNDVQISKPLFHDGFDERSQKFTRGAGGASSEDSEDEEDVQEDGNKAVEWTEVDQKNLMDLGSSERERNRRLESLIARRRARKLLSLQVRKTPVNMGNNGPPGHIDSVLIPRNNPTLGNNSSSQFSPTPGSAPSVLIPACNPFDLPYDPCEEKPNLTGDSFHHEFMVAHQKDMMFCRHESFSLGAFSLWEYKQDRNVLFREFATKQSAFERPDSQLRSQPGKEDSEKQELETSQEGEPILNVESACDRVKQEGQGAEQVFDLVDDHYEECSSEFQTKQMLDEVIKVGSRSSSSSEADEPISRINKEAILKCLSRSVSRNRGVDIEDNSRINDLSFDSGLPGFEKTKVEERLYAVKEMHHTPTHSIASDLQVEVSEVSSPPLTVDENMSFSDEQSSINDGDAQKEISCDSEDTWLDSANLPIVDENESRLGGIYEISVLDIREVESSRINHESNDSVTSDMLPEVVDQYSTNPLSSLLIPEQGQANSTDDNSKHQDMIQTTGSALSPEILGLPVLEGQQSTEKPVAHPSHNDDFKDPEEPYRPEKSNRELDTNNSKVKALEVPTSNVLKILSTINHIENETHILVKQENSSDQSKSSDIITLKLGQCTGKEYEKRDEHQKTILESCKQIEDFDNLNSFGDVEREPETLPECLDMAVNAMPIENNDIWSSIQDTEVEQGNGEVGSLSVGQNFVDPNALTVTAESVVDQVPIASSLSSSPTSVLQPKFSIDQASSLSFDQEISPEVQQSYSDTLEHNLMDELPPANIILAVPQNAVCMMEDSAAHPSCSRDCDTLAQKHEKKEMARLTIAHPDNDQAQSDYEGKSTEKATTSYKLNNLVVSQEEGKLKSVEDIEAEQRAGVGHMELSNVMSSQSAEETTGELKLADDVYGFGPAKQRRDYNENSGTIVKSEESEEAMGHEDVHPPMPAPGAKDNLEANKDVIFITQ
ncbi:unnamed protein product [Ilex paraguariensis]|uniref:Uncharacterized protein n=1 Tax=Ilex paraguariensis TaxID=185542 RepID=A0ABC8T4J4_9AQUA